MYIQGTKMHIIGVNKVQSCNIWKVIVPVTVNLYWICILNKTK